MMTTNAMRTAGWTWVLLALAGCAGMEDSPAPAQADDGGAAAAAPAPRDPGPGPWDKPGFRTVETEGRLWVFREGSEDWQTFLSAGEPAKSVTKVGAGPGGMTIRSGDLDTVAAYMAAKDGFVTEIVDGRLWVFVEGSKDLADFRTHGEPAKSVTKVGAGPGGMTVRSGDADTIASYLAARKGFVTEIVDGRLWVFVEGSKDLADFRAHGEPAKSVTKVGVGPGGMTVRSGDLDTISSYLSAKDGFVTEIVDGRLWVFRNGSKDLADFRAHGEPAKSVTKVGAGPGGMTVRSGDFDTISAYLAAR